MDFEEFINVVKRTRIFLIGEWHQYIGDTAIVLSIIRRFIELQKKPVFFMEHFPGQNMREALIQVRKGNWDAINYFLHTPIDTQGKGNISPLKAWDNPKGELKLKVILRFSQIHNIYVQGHDLNYQDQIRYYQSDGEDKHLAERDQRMFLWYLDFLAKNPKNEVLFSFIGEYHLKQYKRIKPYVKEVTCLRPKKGLAIAGIPLVLDSVHFQKIADGSGYEFVREGS